MDKKVRSCPRFLGWWRGKKAEYIVDEIKYLVDECDAQKILFLDDNAIVNTKRMREISTGLQEKNIKVALGCLGTIDKYDFDTLEVMYQGGMLQNNK